MPSARRRITPYAWVLLPMLLLGASRPAAAGSPQPAPPPDPHTADPAPAATEPSWAGLPLPVEAMKVEDRGSEALYRDARAAARVAEFFSSRLRDRRDATCTPGKPGEALVLSCRVTRPVEQGTLEIVSLRVEAGTGSTSLLLTRTFQVPGKAPTPEVQLIFTPKLISPGPMGKMQQALEPAPPQPSPPPAPAPTPR